MQFPGKIFFCFHFRIYQAKWWSLKQFSFIYFLISWTTRSICGISQIKNPMIPITKIPVMTVARVSFVINYFQTQFEKSFRFRLHLNYFSFEPMDQPCTSETWSRPQSSWTYKISAEQKWQHDKVYDFFDFDELSWFPTISGLHADQGSPTKKFLLIESPRNQNRIVLINVKQFWFRWWRVKVNKSNWRYGKIGWNMNSCF